MISQRLSRSYVYQWHANDSSCSIIFRAPLQCHIYVLLNFTWKIRSIMSTCSYICKLRMFDGITIFNWCKSLTFAMIQYVLLYLCFVQNIGLHRNVDEQLQHCKNVLSVHSLKVNSDTISIYYVCMYSHWLGNCLAIALSWQMTTKFFATSIPGCNAIF